MKKTGQHIKQLLAAAFVLLSVYVPAQETGFTVSGKITDKTGAPLEGITVALKETGTVTTSNSGGLFQLEHIPAGNYTLEISGTGYHPHTQKIRINKNIPSLSVTLSVNRQELAEVTVTGRTANQRAAEQAIKAEVVNVRQAYDQAATLNDMLNRASGVRIRQSGGLGAPPDISINGFQGRSVRYFKDGVPMDYLQGAYNISNIPVNSLERAEVYRGVLPVSLGADALGGAVNLVTRKPASQYAAASYETGSFNTHRATLSAFYQPANGKFFAGMEAFYNYSDNNYKVWVKLTDPDTRNQYTGKVSLFHNGFKSYYAEVYGGIARTRWADRLKISVAAVDASREEQHPALMTDPYGAIMRKQHSVIPSVTYSKSWLDKKWQLEQFLVYNTYYRSRIDTVRGQYDWLGNFTPMPSRRGEGRQPSLSDIAFRYFTSRTNLKYQLNTTNVLELNLVHNGVSRKGSDPLGPRFANTDIDVLAPKADYQKQVLGLGWESKWMDRSLTNYLMAKFYRYYSTGIDSWNARDIHERDRVETNAVYWGVGDALKYQLNSNSFVRLSAEYAYRLPEQEELFGDAVWIVSNFRIQPERSLNLNLGYRLQQPVYTIELNGFYRRTKDMILLVPVQAPYAQYTNMENVKGYGFDVDASVKFLSRFTGNINATWQSLRLFGFTVPQDQWKNDSRLRNTPYFFANAGVTALFDNFIRQGDKLKPYLYYNFIREFYLETIPRRLEPKGFMSLWGSADIRSDLLIPTQHLLTAGVSYQLANMPLSLGLEVKNITNADIYDYYRVQRAGRSFHIKFNFQFIHKKSIRYD